jgi:hypothetical protein
MITMLRATVLAFGFLALSAHAVSASEETNVMGTINRFVAAFNKGDARTALTACANPVSIVDEFPPYAWTGPTGCADWAASYDRNAQRNGITDGFVTLTKPTYVTIVRNRAYVVTHATYVWKEHGKPKSETAARLTVALHKVGGVWLMTAWTWTNN